MSSVQQHQLFWQTHSEIKMITKNRSEYNRLKFSIDENTIPKNQDKSNKQNGEYLGSQPSISKYNVVHTLHKSHKKIIFLKSHPLVDPTRSTLSRIFRKITWLQSSSTYSSQIGSNSY